MKTPSRSFAPTSAAVLALLLVNAPGTRAANLTWNDPLGGLAGVASNWNPAQIPVAADNLRFNLNNTYQVTFGVGVPASRQLLMRDGMVTLRFPTPHSVSTLLDVTPAAAGPTPEATVASGTLNVEQDLFVGDVAGRTGTLNITGSTTTVNVPDPAADVAIGRLGTGTL